MYSTDTVYYTIISKICHKIKNDLIIQKSTKQISDVIPDTFIKFKNYPIKTVKDAFYSYYILYHYFKMLKIREKLKKNQSSKTKR